MSFSITLFGPGHYWWRAFKGRPGYRVWFHRVGEHSGGGAGFCVPGLHVTLHWGAR